MQKVRKQALVADLWPNIRLMQLSGLFFSAFHEDNSTLMRFVRALFSWFTTILLYSQYIFMTTYIILFSINSAQRASGSVTVLFFTHSIIKFTYFNLRSRLFFRALNSWNNANSHPLFTESNARHRTITLKRMRKLLMVVGTITILSVFCWTTLTFVADSVREMQDPESENGTIFVEVPKLLVLSWYPWNPSGGMTYFFTFLYQFYWLFACLSIANLCDTFFCSLVIHACEQLKHLKEIMGPLIELSAALDTQVNNADALFRAASGGSKAALIENEEYETFNSGNNFVSYRNNAVVASGGTGLTKKQEILVRSAIKYWVERHKHIVRYVNGIGDMYGLALLFHMLITTFLLTILAYEATKITGFNAYAFSTIGYLVYALGQVYHFCIYGNELIDESSSVMEAAYSCHWYDGSEEAKTFVQIVCQQCQKALMVTGAKFFTVSLDLFASVLGAVVTYFMVLIQLN